MAVVVAVAVGVLVPGDAADRVVLVVAVDVLHVGPHLGDVHPAVAVEGDRDRLLDVGSDRTSSIR